MSFPTSTSAFAATASQSSNWEMPQTFSTAFSAIYTGFTSMWHATHWLIGTSNPPIPTNIEIPAPSTPKKTCKRDQNKRPADTALRRLIRSSKKITVPEKPIFRQRRLEREGAISDLGGDGRPQARRLGRVGPRREESFVLVDHGDHFRMVKPMYAKTYYCRLPKDFISIAPYHAFGPNIEQEILRKILCEGVASTIADSRQPGTRSKKRVRFKDEDDDDDRPSRSKKARR